MGLFLRQTRGFRLALALYDDPLERDAIIQSLASELATDSIRVLKLDLRVPSAQSTLLARIEEILGQQAEGFRPVVMVVNLDALVEYNPELLSSGSETDFLATANLHRERFATSCPAPLILWTTELLERAFVKQAPDLWQWRSHVFDLRTRSRDEGLANSPLQSNEDHRQHPEVRLQRLEDELAAYRKAGSLRDEMRILNAIGLARMSIGSVRLARNDFNEVLRIAKELGDRHWEGAALGNLGLVHSELGKSRDAIGFFEKSLALYREFDDLHLQAVALSNLGLSIANLGNVPRAIEFHEKALVIDREIGNQRGEAIDLGSIGVAYLMMGDAQRAIEFLEQQLVTARKIGDRSLEGAALGGLGLAYVALGDIQNGIDFHCQHLAIARSMGDRRGEGSASGNLGLAYDRLGDPAKAIACYKQQLTLVRESGDLRGEGNALWNLALAYDSLGQRQEAVFHAEAALPLFVTLESPHLAMVRMKLAEWHAN